ncbi:MAG TPA: hypothetical protein VGS03_15085 [Candidatus Polarisedimenticolia bacterium]|nr:hypothetical protein [Candidatus Polarisedimenticolia bacterium]
MRPRPQSRPPLSRRVALAASAAVLLISVAATSVPALAASPAPAGSSAPQARSADERWLMQGLADFAWSDTDPGSRLLSVNGGDGTGGGALRLWAAGEIAPGFQGFIMGKYESLPPDPGDDRETDTDLEQAYLRYTGQGKARYMAEAGRLVTPVGDFSSRYLPDQNPLVGAPSDYSVTYPEGAKVTGWVKTFDMMAAAVNRPLLADWYAMPSGKAWRPMLSAGWTPITGLRMGLFATQGPYLGEDASASLAQGDSWQDFDQTVEGFEMRYSIGHFELHGQYAASRYEVPGHDRDSRGRVWYVEPRYAFTPRFFAALRVENNDYPYIIPIYGTTWIGNNAQVADIEAGVGVRFLPDLTVKVSYRQDKWTVDEALEDILPDGHAFAAQIAYHFDVRGLVQRPD